ncbi:MAG TPA: DbpA RNA binding domain-containing protein, partial [Polyangiaceae bacterium]|nr:DbpA RNA binding domain-containing protein [Polyangiaceae bacterium]
DNRKAEREYPRAAAGNGSQRERFDTGRAPAPHHASARSGGDWASFRVSWGGVQGADARKVLAMVCRWGEIRGSDVGAIEIERDFSRISVKSSVASGFADATSKPDARNPRVTIRPDQPGASEPPRAAEAPSLAGRGPHKKFAERTQAPAREARSAPQREAPAREAKSAPHRDVRPREPSHPARGVQPRGPSTREAAPAREAARPHAGGFPRDATRPRVATGYPRDAKRAPRPHASARDAARPHVGTREVPRPSDAGKPRDGGDPPRRRRVVTR